MTQLHLLLYDNMSQIQQNINKCNALIPKGVITFRWYFKLFLDAAQIKSDINAFQIIK